MPLCKLVSRLLTESRVNGHALQNFQVRGDGRKDMEQQNLGLETAGQCHGVIENCGGVIIEVERHQYLLDGDV